MKQLKEERLVSGSKEVFNYILFLAGKPPHQTIFRKKQFNKDVYCKVLLIIYVLLYIQQVYQSLDRELQKHVNHQDTLQQSQTWLTAVQEELQLNDQGPSGLQEALKQVPDTVYSFA